MTARPEPAKNRRAVDRPRSSVEAMLSTPNPSRTRRRVGVVIAVATVLLAAPQVALAGKGRHEGSKRSFSGCVRDIGRYGAHVELNARMSADWRNKSKAIVDFAYNESTVNDCGPSGRPTGGGELTLHTRLEFVGDQIEKCSAGFPSGVSCEINPHKTQASYEVSNGPFDNKDGRGALKIGGVEVNTGSSGQIESIKLITTTTLTHGSDQATTQATVDLQY